MHHGRWSLRSVSGGWGPHRYRDHASREVHNSVSARSPLALGCPINGRSRLTPQLELGNLPLSFNKSPHSTDISVEQQTRKDVFVIGIRRYMSPSLQR